MFFCERTEDLSQSVFQKKYMNFRAKYLSKTVGKKKNIHPSSMFNSLRGKDKKYQHILKIIKKKKKSKQTPQIHKAFQTSRFEVSHSLNKC